jgi:hypothetical protein
MLSQKLNSLKWWWRLRSLPSKEELDHAANTSFHAYIRYQLAMAKHREYLDISFRP